MLIFYKEWQWTFFIGNPVIDPFSPTFDIHKNWADLNIWLPSGHKKIKAMSLRNELLLHARRGFITVLAIFISLRKWTTWFCCASKPDTWLESIVLTFSLVWSISSTYSHLQKHWFMIDVCVKMIAVVHPYVVKMIICFGRKFHEILLNMVYLRKLCDVDAVDVCVLHNVSYSLLWSSDVLSYVIRISFS